jgi:hypothetical protein
MCLLKCVITTVPVLCIVLPFLWHGQFADDINRFVVFYKNVKVHVPTKLWASSMASIMSST